MVGNGAGTVAGGLMAMIWPQNFVWLRLQVVTRFSRYVWTSQKFTLKLRNVQKKLHDVQKKLRTVDNDQNCCNRPCPESLMVCPSNRKRRNKEGAAWRGKQSNIIICSSLAPNLRAVLSSKVHDVVKKISSLNDWLMLPWTKIPCNMPVQKIARANICKILMCARIQVNECRQFRENFEQSNKKFPRTKRSKTVHGWLQTASMRVRIS